MSANGYMHEMTTLGDTMRNEARCQHLSLVPSPSHSVGGPGSHLRQAQAILALYSSPRCIPEGLPKIMLAVEHEVV